MTPPTPMPIPTPTPTPMPTPMTIKSASFMQVDSMSIPKQKEKKNKGIYSHELNLSCLNLGDQNPCLLVCPFAVDVDAEFRLFVKRSSDGTKFHASPANAFLPCLSPIFYLLGISHQSGNPTNKLRYNFLVLIGLQVLLYKRLQRVLRTSCA